MEVTAFETLVGHVNHTLSHTNKCLVFSKPIIPGFSINSFYWNNCVREYKLQNVVHLHVPSINLINKMLSYYILK